VSFSKRQFFYSLMALLLAVATLNVLIAATTRNTAPRWVMARARRFPYASVLAIGNSLVAAGFDPTALDLSMKLPPEQGSLNLALGASSPVEQLLLLRYALREHIRPRVVVYGFYDLQLSTPVRLTTGDLFGNHAMLYYLEPEYARNFYYLSFHDRVEFELMHHLPMTVERGSYWTKVERFRRKISQQGMPEEKTNRFGRAGDFAVLEASSPQEFAAACDAASSQELIAPVNEIIRQASAAGAKVVFVEMPMVPDHVREFYQRPEWLRYREHVQQILAPRGVSYVDASDWIADGALYLDHIHLGPEGAAQFSARLGEYLNIVISAPPPGKPSSAPHE
jgi:hypothetical protein